MTTPPAQTVPDPDGYWSVTFRAFAFDSQAEADAFATRLIDTFLDMPESAALASSTAVRHETAEGGAA